MFSGAMSAKSRYLWQTFAEGVTGGDLPPAGSLLGKKNEGERAMANKKPQFWCLWALALLVLAVLPLAGCGGTPTSSGAVSSPSPHAPATRQPPVPSELQIIRFAPHEVRVAPFSVQTDDAAKVQSLFATLRALPPFREPVSCMQDGGGGYILTFLDHGKVIAVATIAASGCPRIHISDPYGCHTPNDATMSEIADTLGVPSTDLGIAGEFYNTAKPGGALAPDDPYVPPVTFSPCR